MSGYQDPLYAASLAEFGDPLRLEGSGGWVVTRPIPGTRARDAMGVYPLFSCQNWAQLPDDVRALEHSDLVSLSLVTDPFGECDLADLTESFDRVVPFKDHFVADMTLPREELVSKNHRRMARRALRAVQVDLCEDPASMVDTWVELFEVLRGRHNISALRAFSPDSFAVQLRVPGTVVFVANVGGEVVGMDWWYVQGDVAQGHLAAFSNLGYDVLASYATKWYAMEYFATRVRWMNLGGAPGTMDNGTDGLTRFKRGWTSDTRKAYFCGRILNAERYGSLCDPLAQGDNSYFPAYRRGEFDIADRARPQN